VPISGRGWELHVERLGLQVAGSKTRTYSSYQAYQDGKPLDGLSGYICECVGPGENGAAGSAKRIEQGSYPLSTQFGEYRSIGYSDDTSTPGRHPMPALLLRNTGNRSGILIHPGHPPNLFLSSIGCLNPSRGLLSWQSMDFWDSRSRVIALIDDLRRFAPDAFKADEDTQISNATIVIDGEPSNVIVSPDEAIVATARVSSDFVTQLSNGPALEVEDAVAPAASASSPTGADTNYVVRQDVIDAASKQLGGAPMFWGRYFKGKNNPDDAQYKGALENGILRTNNISVLPVGRQTNHVSGGEQLGRTDGKNNADALVEAFGLDYLRSRTIRALVFLDVEPENPVSPDYYFGWASAIVEYQNPPIFAPALYGNYGSSATWPGLSKAVARGAECHGLWIARYFIKAGCYPKPAWSDDHAVPPGIPAGCPVFALQYSAECAGVDCSIVNPAFATALSGGLILPPAQPALTAERMAVERMVVARSVTSPSSPAQAAFSDALQVTLEQLEAKKDVKRPDGKPFFFPDGIKSLEIAVTVGTETGVTLKINEGQ
jgi:hypothetical protein